MWLEQEDDSPPATERRSATVNIDRQDGGSDHASGSELGDDVEIKKGLENDVSSPLQKEPDDAWFPG